MKLVFGDLLRNGWAGDDNPDKMTMVLFATSLYIHTVDRRGREVLMSANNTKVTKVGSIDMAAWDGLYAEGEKVAAEKPTRVSWCPRCGYRSDWDGDPKSICVLACPRCDATWKMV